MPRPECRRTISSMDSVTGLMDADVSVWLIVRYLLECDGMKAPWVPEKSGHLHGCEMRWSKKRTEALTISQSFFN